MAQQPNKEDAPLANVGRQDQVLQIRLKEIQRSHRLLKWCFIVFAILSVGGFTAYLLLKRTETAGVFRLVDEKGVVRATLGTEDGATRLKFMGQQGYVEGQIVAGDRGGIEFADGDGKVIAQFFKLGTYLGLAVGDEELKARAILQVSKDGPELKFTDPAGNPLVWLTVSPGGRLRLRNLEDGITFAVDLCANREGGVLDLVAVSGHSQVHMASELNKGSTLILNKGDRAFMALTVGGEAKKGEDKEGATFKMADRDGKLRASLSTSDKDVSLIMSDADSKPRAKLLVTDTGPRLVFTDSAGAEVKPVP